MSCGKVWLVGAGPGDVELLTLKAVRALGEADVVLLDSLVNRAVLQYVRKTARVIEVGKRGGCRSTPQAFIERKLLQLARQGLTVARVKGGDPCVFGRGGEEAETLARAGVPVEIVPGVTAGIGIPPSLGIPVTHRALCRGVTLVTGSAGAELDWQALAAGGTTLVIYMGLKNLPAIATALAAAGMPAHMPLAAVQDGTLPSQRQVVTTLGEAAAAVRRAGLKSPVLVVVGDVVRYARRELSDLSETLEEPLRKQA